MIKYIRKNQGKGPGDRRRAGRAADSNGRPVGGRSCSRPVSALCLCMAASTALSCTAMASPEFAHSSEKWETLRDNVMEYHELADLIHEYNATVINNRLEYDEYRGKSHDDLKNAYQDMADSLYSSSDKMVDSAVEGAPGYDSAMASAALARVQAEQNQEMADAQNEDSYVKKMEYNRAEAVLVQSAQTKMNAYWQKAKNSPALEEALITANTEYEAMAVKASGGMIAQAELLAAKEKTESAQAAVETNQKEMDALRRELCIMTGWSYDSQPEIREIPIPSQEEVDSIDLEADKALALELNYTQNANEQRLKHTSKGAQYDVMDKKVKTGHQQIAADVEAKYKLLTQARSDYILAEGEYQLAVNNQQSAQLRYSIGAISQNEYLKSRESFAGTLSARDVAALKFSQAMENYRWTVNGLAQTEGE